MNVAELIKRLQEMDQDADVLYWDAWNDQYSWVRNVSTDEDGDVKLF